MTNISYQNPEINLNYASPRPSSPVQYSTLPNTYPYSVNTYEEPLTTSVNYNYNISQVQPPLSPLRMSNTYQVQAPLSPLTVSNTYANSPPSSPMRTSFIYSGKLYSNRTYRGRSLHNRRKRRLH